MDASRQRVLFIVGLLGVFAVTAGIWLLLSETDEPGEILADGTVVRLRGVTYGKEHRIISGPTWQRMVGRALPGTLARRWSIPVINHATTNNALVVWLEFDTRAVQNRFLYSGPAVAIGDEHGSEFSSAARTSSRTTANGFVQGYEMPIVPPGALTVIVRQAAPGLATQLRFRRPAAARRHSSGTRQPSATSRVDNLEVVVRTLESMPPSPMYPRTWADCLILEDGQPTTNWMVRLVDVLDDAGGFHRAPVSCDGLGRVSMGVGLSTNEVWRLRFFLARTGGFESNDLISIPGVPLTVSDRAAFRPVTNTVNGVIFVLYDVSGFGICGLSALVVPSDEPFDVTAVRATDNEGRRLILGQSPGQTLRDNSWLFSFTMKTVLESKTADVTFAVTRMKSVEVFVKPTAATNVPSIFRPRDK